MIPPYLLVLKNKSQPTLQGADWFYALRVCVVGSIQLLVLLLAHGVLHHRRQADVLALVPWLH
jgi:hypothetical protein